MDKTESIHIEKEKSKKQSKKLHKNHYSNCSNSILFLNSDTMDICT